MTQQTKTNFTSQLLNWYHANARQLPWRLTSDPYAIWVSETMLQQTRVDTVIPYYHRFLNQFSTVTALAQAEETEVLKCWEGLGYYRRARLLHQGAQEVLDRYCGIIPNTLEDLLALPGIGPYMAGAIASIAFQVPVPAIDGNVIRVTTRQLAWEEPSDTSHSKQAIATWVKNRIPATQPGDFTQSLMELGALVCLPRNPHCPDCPVRSFCGGQANPHQYPVKKAVRAVPVERRIALVITWKTRRLLIQRPPHGLMADFWEYPHLLANADADPLAIADAWCLEQLGNSLKLQFERRMTHIYSHLRWELEIYRASWEAHKAPLTPKSGNWFSPSEENQLPRVAFTRKLSPAETME